MKTIDKIYINGEFVKPKGNQIFDLISPTTNQLIGQVALGNKQDAQDAIAAAKEAFRTFFPNNQSRTYRISETFCMR